MSATAKCSKDVLAGNVDRVTDLPLRSHFVRISSRIAGPWGCLLSSSHLVACPELFFSFKRLITRVHPIPPSALPVTPKINARHGLHLAIMKLTLILWGDLFYMLLFAGLLLLCIASPGAPRSVPYLPVLYFYSIFICILCHLFYS